MTDLLPIKTTINFMEMMAAILSWVAMAMTS